MPDVMFMQGQTKFLLLKAKERAALAALKASHYASHQYVESARTLTAALAAIGWHVHRDDNGNIDGIVAGDEYMGLVEKDLEILAPFVKSGSSMVFEYASGKPTIASLLSFDGKSATVRKLTKREMATERMFDKPDFDAEDHAKPTPLGSGTAPAKRTPYSPSSTFERGEWIEHPKFGAGLVTEKLDGPCVRVAFSDEGRVLVHARA